MLRHLPSLYLQVQGHISADPTAQLGLGNIFLQNVKTQFLTKKLLELFNTNSSLMSTYSSPKKKKKMSEKNLAEKITCFFGFLICGWQSRIPPTPPTDDFDASGSFHPGKLCLLTHLLPLLPLQCRPYFPHIRSCLQLLSMFIFVEHEYANTMIILESRKRVCDKFCSLDNLDVVLCFED